ncbi:hypothetical protein Tco_1066777 [Tanacetum coccineum]|uniref:Uncharacterized protein n=1 Tax=Tanacetum coccineum TaxID=301880 RepID=A0ABQ5HBK3_9ASTR
MLNSMRHQFNPLFHEAAFMTGRNRDFWRTLPEPSRQRQFERIILNFMRDQEEELRQLKEYMNEIDNEFMHLSLMVIEMVEEKIRAQESKKIQKITKFLDAMEAESLNAFRPCDTTILPSYSIPSPPPHIRVRDLKVFIGNFTYECDFMILEDTTSIIDHDLGEIAFGKPFIEQTGLAYDKEEGTIVFRRNDDKITFKMPHRMEKFRHVDLKDMNTDPIPPLILGITRSTGCAMKPLKSKLNAPDMYLVKVEKLIYLRASKSQV